MCEYACTHTTTVDLVLLSICWEEEGLLAQPRPTCPLLTLPPHPLKRWPKLACMAAPWVQL